MRPETKAEATEREQRASAAGITLDGHDVLLRGRRIGHVTEGVNGEWFAITLDQGSWADPLQGMDNVVGYGHRTPLSAALDRVE